MDLLWAAMGICVVVAFVFFVLSKHWQRVLKQQSWAIRRLTERVRDLEEMADPEFLRRLNESAPSPLEEVFTFTFRLSDSFWRETVGLKEADVAFVRTMGSVPGSVKIERWRGHVVVRITEVLPESRLASWQTRTLDVYPEKVSRSEPIVLWETPLALPDGLDAASSLRLALEDETLTLALVAPSSEANGAGSAHAEDRIFFFRVPLDPTRLVEFRSHDPLGNASNGNGQPAASGAASEASSWQAFYANEDEGLGFQWQLWIRDLRKKAEWDRWKILESPPVSVSGPNR
jgi:hypothetical protein